LLHNSNNLPHNSNNLLYNNKNFNSSEKSRLNGRFGSQLEFLLHQLSLRQHRYLYLPTTTSTVGSWAWAQSFLLRSLSHKLI
jgi:hypothetical protein